MRIMDYDIAWLAKVGLDTKAGLDYTGNEERYMSAVQRFYNNYEKNRAKVETCFKDKDYENYMITVHALKSNAKMIGAMKLSSEFEELETASRNNDFQVVEAKTNPVLSDYESLIESLKPIGDMEEVHAADEISGEEAIKTADELIEALDDFDDELAKKLVQKLSGYPFRITQRDRLKEAAAFINDFMYDEAAEIIKEIYTGIE